MRTVPALVVVSLLLVAAVSPVAAADSRTGGRVVVEAGETVDGLTATAGEVVVAGTVEGDLTAYAGTVRIVEGGTVEGRLRAYAGSVVVDGTVEGDILAYAGSVEVGRTGVVDDTLVAATGSVAAAGVVRGDVTTTGDVRLSDGARVTADINYGGELDAAPGATVGGQTRQTEEFDAIPSAPPVSGPLFFLYGVLTNLLFGGLLLRFAPGLLATVRDELERDPLRTAGTGIAAVVVAALAAVALAVTVVGIPLALAWVAVVVAVAWTADVSARVAVGAAALDRLERGNNRAAVVVGVVGVAVLAQVPYLGPVVRAIVVVAGAGGLVAYLRDIRFPANR